MPRPDCHPPGLTQIAQNNTDAEIHFLNAITLSHRNMIVVIHSSASSYLLGGVTAAILPISGLPPSVVSSLSSPTHLLPGIRQDFSCICFFSSKGMRFDCQTQSINKFTFLLYFFNASFFVAFLYHIWTGTLLLVLSLTCFQMGSYILSKGWISEICLCDNFCLNTS